MGKRRDEGGRIPAGWELSDALIVWAAMRRPDLTRADVEAQAEAFLDYWLAETGPKAHKADWDAAFRTWLRRHRKVAAGKDDFVW